MDKCLGNVFGAWTSAFESLGRVRKRRVEASREQRKGKLGSLCRLLWWLVRCGSRRLSLAPWCLFCRNCPSAANSPLRFEVLGSATSFFGAFDQRLVVASVFCFEVVLRSGVLVSPIDGKDVFADKSDFAEKSYSLLFVESFFGVAGVVLRRFRSAPRCRECLSRNDLVASWAMSMSAPLVSASLSQMSFVSRRFCDV